jgi:coatomer protein complex subunit gamma
MAAPGSAPQSLKETIKEKIATALKDNLKLEEREFVNPWSNQDKASVLQQTRCFSDTPIDSEKCLQLITRVLYLLQQGEKFTSQELTDLFFGVTKLFQVQSTRLRRMVFLVIKELEPPDEIAFIVASSLIKDMNGKNDCFRANSIRVLSRVLDPSMVAQIDRYLKTAIVDKNPFVASSALVCGMTLNRTVPDVVKRWVSEIQETTGSKHAMVQFHALALIYDLKKQDRLALHKVVLGLAKASSKSPMAECLLIRYATQILTTERDQQIEKTLISYLDSCLRHKSEMVCYEAARAFCQLAVMDTHGGSSSSVLGHDISHVTTTLQIYLTSPKPVVRFGAIRTLNMLAQHRPSMAARCNVDMETLLSDANRNTATLALTTLLKTGHESNVESLVKQITTFMSDISDVFKIEVVGAVKGLCLKYPSKYKTLMSFLSTNLREDGSADFKKDLVDALLLIISQVPAAREVGLLHLSEFIEDCEYPNLCTKILAFLGEEVPNTSLPSKYIRFIYNRMILENAPVRAASVDTLTKIAMRCPSLRRDVMLLLQFAQNDNDDEVRERISLYSNVIQQCLDEKAEDAQTGFQPLMTGELPFSMDALFDGLLDHVNSENKGQKFNVSILPTKEVYDAQLKAQAALQPEKKKPGVGVSTAAAVEETAQQQAEKKANANAELSRVLGEIVGDASLVGALQHSTRPKSLTESEAEYTVQVVKHMFKQHLVLEFAVKNTVEGIALEDVGVVLTGVEPAFAELGATKINRLDNGQQTALTVVLQKNGGDERAGAVLGNFGARLSFRVLEEGDNLGYEDEYPIEDLHITTGDYMFPRAMPTGQFKSAWEQLTVQGAQATQQLALNFKTLDAAVAGMINILNMEACENTGKVEPGVRGHTLNMSGTFLGGHTCLVKALVGMEPNHGCIAKITCRSKSEQVAELLAKAMM